MHVGFDNFCYRRDTDEKTVLSLGVGISFR